MIVISLTKVKKERTLIIHKRTEVVLGMTMLRLSLRDIIPGVNNNLL